MQAERVLIVQEIDPRGKKCSKPCRDSNSGLPNAPILHYSQLNQWILRPRRNHKFNTEQQDFLLPPVSLLTDYFSARQALELPQKRPHRRTRPPALRDHGLACENDAYPFQIPLEGRTGPQVKADGHSMLMLSSYDYLGLIGDPRIDAAAIEAIRKYGTGTGGARLLTGTTDQHILMEQDLAAYKGTEAAITFSSGYMANVAVLGALLGPADRVIMDSLCHRSLTDACRFAGVQLQRFRHNDASSLRQELQNGAQANRTLVISDGVFSMDGDVCHLPEILEVKKEFGFFLLVDESHASGVIGARGRGTDEHFGIATEEVDIWTGSLAKSIPSTGGFAAVSHEMAIYLQHGASPFIFSAALSPAAVAAIREGLAILKARAGAGGQDQAQCGLSAQWFVLAWL